MKVLGTNTLIQFGIKHGNAKVALEDWQCVAQKADWKTPHEIKARYASVDFLSGNRVIFNIKGNHFRLVTRVEYSLRIVAIEWVGTHAECEKKRFV